MRRGREVNLHQSRQYNLSKNLVDEDLLIGVSSNSPMRDSMYLKETESSRNRAKEIMRLSRNCKSKESVIQ